MSSRFAVTVLPQAEQDADLIFAWLHGKSRQGALAWYEAFSAALQELAHQGDIYNYAPESERVKRPVRQKLFKTSRGRTYRILFEIEADQLYILHIRAPGQKLLSRSNLRKHE